MRGGRGLWLAEGESRKENIRDKEGRSQGLQERSSQGREVGSLSQSKIPACLLSCPRYPIAHRPPLSSAEPQL